MDIVKTAEQKTKDIITYTHQELLSTRSNRPSPRMVEDIPVEAYGQKMSVKQLGAISILPPAQIQIAVWDKAAVTAVAKAVENSNLKVNANIDGTVIKINLPPLSQERRQELIKFVKKESEEAKIKIRAAREDANKEINSQFEDKAITEDQRFKLREKVQEIIDKANKEIDALLETKIAEINE